MQDPTMAPEIDDELAAMEANAAGARGVNRTQAMLNAVLGKRSGKGTPSQGPTKQRSGQGRALRRQMERGAPGYRPDPAKRSHARLGRAKLVKSQAQIASEFRASARAQLSKAKLHLLLPHCPDIKYVVGTPGIRNAWQLSTASTATIHAIPGLGPKRRQAIRKYLLEHQVPVHWEA